LKQKRSGRKCGFHDRKTAERFSEQYAAATVDQRIQAAKNYHSEDRTFVAVLDKKNPAFLEEVMVQDKPYLKNRLLEGMSDQYEDFVLISATSRGFGICFVGKNCPDILEITSWGNTGPLIEKSSWGGKVDYDKLALVR
jgi:hypothetical protein